MKDNLESRYHELMMKNNGRDTEEELRVGVIHKLREEVANSTTLELENDSRDGKGLSMLVDKQQNYGDLNTCYHKFILDNISDIITIIM